MMNTPWRRFNSILVGLMTVLSVSCKNTDGFAPGIEITSGYQLAYGYSATDRILLANRIAGNVEPPKFTEVISRWKRFSGTDYYPDPSLIVANPAYCQTTLDLITGLWANSVNPSVNPNLDGPCNTPSMNSLSWIFLREPDRLFNIQNTSVYNGFFSGIKFDSFVSLATVSSDDQDDDAIGLSIAVYFNSVTNEVHTLSAYRTQGGFPSPSMGWGLLHKVNGNVVATIGNRSIGGTNATGSTGDRMGWNGRNSRIRVERTKNIIKASCSSWGTSGVVNPIDPASEIILDLSDPANNLTDFIGPQAIGYETISQAQATFTDLQFNVPQADSDPEYLFDLKSNSVYVKKANGIGYELAPSIKALDSLGFPKTITNMETQREFMIQSSTSFTEL